MVYVNNREVMDWQRTIMNEGILSFRSPIEPKIKYTIVCAVKVYMLSFIDSANNTNTNPEQNSSMKYLGRIFSLQYLHFAPKNI